MQTDPEIHEAANLFPLDEESLGRLAADIREQGQRVPIELFDGRVIDGRRRLLACRRAGVEPQFRTVEVKDPVAYVLSLNLERRHLDTSQRAMVAARAKEMFDAQAKERQSRAGGDKRALRANLPEALDAGRSRDIAGRMTNVGGRTVDEATAVLRRADPEVVKAVDDGRMSVYAASKILDEPKEVQREMASTSQGRKRPSAKKEDPAGDVANDEPIKVIGVGVDRANEAINCLIRIPKNDALRKRGFQIVTDWIRRNP